MTSAFNLKSGFQLFVTSCVQFIFPLLISKVDARPEFGMIVKLPFIADDLLLSVKLFGGFIKSKVSLLKLSLKNLLLYQLSF